MHPDAVRNTVEAERFKSSQALGGPIIDPYLSFIRQMIEAHPYLRATRVCAIVRDRGVIGGIG
ncbi:MAG TPA: hypothetical protein VFQ91_14995 [Bryobacteraceae bacterium]|nr:hypothetical protein [Bryobacteraceae bacterium]